VDGSALSLLTGRRILITGSSRGIGWQTALGLARYGARVVVHSRHADEAAAAARRIQAEVGGEVPLVAEFDVTDADAVVDGVRGVVDALGALDVLVNNAGVQHREPLLEVSVEDWNRVLATNLTSAFTVGRAAARHMIRQGGGKIINIASIQADLARPTIGPYTASKGGLRNLTRAMAAEWAREGLQVNAVAPGYIRTEMTAPLVNDAAFDKWVRERTPAGRWGEAEDVVGPIAFLASPLAAFVNGQTIFVDGGMSVVV
jgi:gluconate 5-dehydrogenase